MALSASSVLHYWSGRYGPVPIIGGKPVHTRNSAARTIDQRGIIYAPIINTPRPYWDTIDGDRRTTLLLEMAKTNNILYGSDFSNAVWTKTNLTVTTGRPDPAGGTGASTLTATAVNGNVSQVLAAGANIVRTNSIWIRRRTGSGTVQLMNPQATAYVTVTVTDKWARVSTTGTANTSRGTGILLATSGDAVDVYAAQQDDAAFTTSEILTTSAAVTRSADVFYWDYIAPPQHMMVYTRHVERGTISEGGRIWQISDSASNNAVAFVFMTGGFYALAHSTTAGSGTAPLAAAPAIGDTVELVASIGATGIIEIRQSINGAAVTTSGAFASATPAAAWSDTKLWINSAGSTAVGANRFAEVKIVKGGDVAGATAQTIMDELRAFEVSASGEVLA